MSELRCLLICPNETHPPVDLPDQKPVVIGRTAEMNITDTLVSRRHVQLTADFKQKKVHVTQLAQKPCVVSGELLEKGKSADVSDGNSIFLLKSDKHQNIVRFVEPPAAGIKGSGKIGNAKRKADVQEDDSENSPSKRGKVSPTVSVGDECRVSDSDGDEISKQAVQERLEQMRTLAAQLGTCSSSTSVPSERLQSSLDTACQLKVISVISDTAQAPAASSSWLEQDGLLAFTSKGVKASSKIAAFDLDGTIIGTQSGKTFPTHCGDWKLLMPEVPGRLKQLVADGYKIVIISNQKGIEKKKVSISEFEQKVESIVSKLNIPVQALFSTGSGQYRKPGTGMWNYLLDQANCGVVVNVADSFYVGDAAGRPVNWAPKKKKDFSCSDRLLALNIGVKFYTPEEFFQKQSPAKFTMPTFNPRDLDLNTPLLLPDGAKLTLDKQEVIVMFGLPAAGKSQFVRTSILPKGYVHVNRDTLGTWEKCAKATSEALAGGNSVVVDNTNPDVESRSRYVEIAKKAKVACRCFMMTTSIEHALHNERACSSRQS